MARAERVANSWGVEWHGDRDSRTAVTVARLRDQWDAGCAQKLCSTFAEDRSVDARRRLAIIKGGFGQRNGTDPERVCDAGVIGNVGWKERWREKER